jgi:hypothetical protein
MKAMARTVLKGSGLVALAIMFSACGGGSSGGSGGDLMATTTQNVVPVPGTLQFSAAAYSANESQGAVVVTVTRTGQMSGTATGTVTAASGTAASGADFTATTTIVTFADGDAASKTVSIPLINDATIESSESFAVTLSSTSLGSVSSATVTIQDDDSAGAIQLSRSSLTIGEGGGSLELGIDRVNGSSGAISATIATQNGTAIGGQDFTPVTTTVTFAAGDAAQKVVAIPILPDGIAESDESFTVVLSAPTGGATLGTPTTATITIVANDQPQPPPAGGQPGALQLSAATLDVNESGSNAVMTVSRVGGSVGAVTVRLVTANSSALAGQDYAAINTVVTFANGDTTDKFVNIPILNDSIAESAESFTVSLSTPTGGAILGTPTNTVVSIEDNDPPAAFTTMLSTDIRRIHLSWPALPTVTAYKVYFNSNGISGFTQLGGDLTPATTTYDIDVTTYKFNWSNALYRVEACNDVGCTGSASVSTINSMLNAIGYFKGQAVDALDQFGASVALSGDGNTLVVGVPGEDSNATTINGNSANNASANSGAAYVFARTNGVWARQAYLKASNAVAGDRFGSSLSISNGGNTVAVGAPSRSSGAGSVYIFVRSGTTWTQQSALVAPNAQAGDNFGAALSLNSDASSLVVGAPNEASNANTINGSQADNSASGAGAAYVFVRSGTVWTHQTYLKATNTAVGDAFGTAVAISGDGTTIAIGAAGEDSDAITINGDQGNNLAADSGAVYVFIRSGATWLAPTYLKSGNSEAGDVFGSALSLSNDGNTLAIGASLEDGAVIDNIRRADSEGCVTDNPANIAQCESGAVYVFSRSAGVWSQQAYLKSSNSQAFDLFGGALALSSDGNSLVVGAINDDSSGAGVGGDQFLTDAKQSGAAYLFARTSGAWAQSSYLKAPNPNTDDVFGTSLAINADGSSLVVGAIGEDSNAIDVSGSRTDNSLSNAGAAYLY